jgi:hypothetical protein
MVTASLKMSDVGKYTNILKIWFVFVHQIYKQGKYNGSYTSDRR